MTERKSFLEQLELFAQHFAEQYLNGYLNRLSKGQHIPREPKEFNDSIWGTIKLSQLEVIILDSPLVQRLRLVRQLGVVHWVYPGASHSRFEHTLGVLHQTQRLIYAINQASGEEAINSDKASLIRLCAVLHDIGHSVFSHVSEHAIASNKDVGVALADFAKREKLESTPHLSEVFAYNVIGSRAFENLLATGLDKLGQPIKLVNGSPENAKEITGKIKKAIIGHHIDDSIPLLHEIISGPYDADKLDYYTRDARQAGVPSILDISRLIQKLTTKSISGRDLPVHIAKRVTSNENKYWLFGLKASGASLLDELHLTRMLLYTKIYRHKKVQAIEAMISALFGAIESDPMVEPIDLVKFAYGTTDDQLLAATSSMIFKKLGAVPTADLSDFVDEIIQRLRERNLYVASVALKDVFEDDPLKDTIDQKFGLGSIISDCKNPQRVTALKINLITELKELLKCVPEAIADFNPKFLDYAISIFEKSPLGSGTTIDRALIYNNGKFIRGRDLDQSNRAALAPAMDFGNPSVTFFTPREIAAATYIAAERVFWKEYKVIFPGCAISQCKQSLKELDSLREKLAQTDWYRGIPVALRPVPNRLKKQDIEKRAEQIATTLIKIDEPDRPESESGQQSQMVKRVKDWLTQFSDDHAIEGALTCLEAFKVLDRSDTRKALSAFVDKNPEFKNAVICPLGNLKDSGTVQAYLVSDSQNTFAGTMTVDEAVKRNGSEPIVFIDDIICSGRQVEDMLGNWFDHESLKNDDLEEIRFKFNDNEQRFFRSRNIAFVFVAGWEDGQKKAQTALETLGLEGMIYVHIRDCELPFADQTNNEQRAFLDKAEKIGRELLASNDKSEEKQKERALGYGNRAMLLASRFNVPTQTISCFWMEGIYDGIPWQPLIRRRTKT